MNEKMPGAHQPRENMSPYTKAKRGYINRVFMRAGDIDQEHVARFKEDFKTLSPAEKALLLYRKIMAEHKARVQDIRERGANYFSYQQDSKVELISDESGADDLLDLVGIGSIDSVAYESMKALWEDEEARNIFLETYARAREEYERVKNTERAQKLKELKRKIERQNLISTMAAQKLLLKKYRNTRQQEALRQILENVGKTLEELYEEKKDIFSIDRWQEQLPANTDVIALDEYEKIASYAEQKFVWTESRKKILHNIIAQMGNGRSIVALVGEAGTGKSELAVAAARELTGSEPERVACTEDTTVFDLVGTTEIENNETYKKYGPIVRAFTGYTDSRQKEPVFKTGRVVRLDEFNRLGDKPYAFIKYLAQLKPGDILEGKPVLPGAGIILTMNPPGPRYPGRREIDVAMEREISMIDVSYPDADEIYEFLESSLMENGVIAADVRELSPYYHPGEVLDDPLPVKDENGNETDFVITRKPDELEENVVALDKDGKPLHGALWRLAHAVGDIQKAFVYGNKTRIPADYKPRFIKSDENALRITDDGSGDPLTLTRPTITLGEVRSWMNGYNTRFEKSDPAYRTKTLEEWIALKVQLYLEQIGEEENPEDYRRVRALFEHYHLLDNNDTNLDGDMRIATPLDIGYFSPTVPRPVTVERSNTLQDDSENNREESETIARTFEYTDRMIESGDIVPVDESATAPYIDPISNEKKTLQNGSMIFLDGKNIKFIGVVAHGAHEGELVFDVSGDGSMHMALPYDTSVAENGDIVLGFDIRFFKSEADKFMRIAESGKRRACRKGKQNI